MFFLIILQNGCIISSLQTLVNCSLCAKTCKKKIKIVLCIHPNTDSNLVKNLTAIEGIRLLKKVESWQSYSQFEEDVKNYLSDNYEFKNIRDTNFWLPNNDLYCKYLLRNI